MGVARRGDTVWTLDKFETHLAQAVQLEHVGAMLGAGASLGCGGKTIQQLWSQYVTENPDQTAQLEALRFILEDRVDPPNIEVLIDKLVIAQLDAARSGRDVAQLLALYNSLLRAVLKASLLDRDWLRDPTSAATASGLSDHVRLLTRLVHTRQPGQPAPWVFTTNYDMAIELAAENASLNVRDGFRGFHNRVFSPSSFDLGLRNTESRGEAQFGTYEIYLAKLHGSLSWEQTASGDVRAFQIDARCGDIFDFVDGNTATSPSSLIFPSSAKFVDTVGFVYGEMIRRFTHFLSRPNVTLLISGYGFGDFHLNRVLLSALNNPTLQLVVYLPEINGFEANGDPTNLADLRPGLVKFLNLKLPQVAILGGGAAAYFSEMTSHLPDPTILDDPAERSRQIAKALAQELNPTTPTTPPTPTTTTPIL